MHAVASNQNRFSQTQSEPEYRVQSPDYQLHPKHPSLSYGPVGLGNKKRKDADDEWAEKNNRKEDIKLEWVGGVVVWMLVMKS